MEKSGKKVTSVGLQITQGGSLCLLGALHIMIIWEYCKCLGDFYGTKNSSIKKKYFNTEWSAHKFRGALKGINTR